MTHQDLEGCTVSLLRLADQTRVVNAVALRCQRALHIPIRRGVPVVAAVIRWSLIVTLIGTMIVIVTVTRTVIVANRKCYCVRIGRHCLCLSPCKLSPIHVLALHRNRRISTPNVSRLQGVGPWFAAQHVLCRDSRPGCPAERSSASAAAGAAPRDSRPVEFQPHFVGGLKPHLFIQRPPLVAGMQIDRL